MIFRLIFFNFGGGYPHLDIPTGVTEFKSGLFLWAQVGGREGVDPLDPLNPPGGGPIRHKFPLTLFDRLCSPLRRKNFGGETPKNDVFSNSVLTPTTPFSDSFPGGPTKPTYVVYLFSATRVKKDSKRERCRCGGRRRWFGGSMRSLA